MADAEQQKIVTHNVYENNPVTFCGDRIIFIIQIKTLITKIVVRNLIRISLDLVTHQNVFDNRVGIFLYHDIVDFSMGYPKVQEKDEMLLPFGNSIRS